jgi:hypothetical protein
MTIQEAHRQFNLFLDKVSSESTGELSHKQIDVFLHEAEVRLVKQAYGQNNIYKKGYQEIQKRTDDLNTLVLTGYLELDEEVDGVYRFPLTNIFTTESLQTNTNLDYMFFVKAMVKVKSSTVEPVYTGITLIPHDKYTEVIKDPFNKSRISSPIAFFEDSSIKIDTNNNSFEPMLIKLTYIGYPRMVVWKAAGESGSIPSILPEQKQREAIQLAVRIASGTLESNRIEEINQQINSME